MNKHRKLAVVFVAAFGFAAVLVFVLWDRSRDPGSDKDRSSIAALDKSGFLAEYAKHEPYLYDQYVKNRRIKVVVKAYSKVEPTGAFEGQAEDTIVTRGDAFRANSIMRRLDKTEPYKAGAMWFDDEAYRVSQTVGMGYKLDEHYPESNRKHKINETAARYKLFLPLSLSDGISPTDYFESMSKVPSERRPEIKSFGPVTRAGRQVIQVVVFGPASRTTTTSYLDPQNHYAFLEYERDRLVTMKGPQEGRMSGVLTYVDGPEGFPIPKEYKEWFILPGGKRVPKEEVQFTEYERYTPTDDDFDLEKQFGLKPFPKPPKPEVLSSTGSRRGWWLWIGAGVLGVAAVGLIASLWRRGPATDTD